MFILAKISVLDLHKKDAPCLINLLAFNEKFIIKIILPSSPYNKFCRTNVLTHICYSLDFY